MSRRSTLRPVSVAGAAQASLLLVTFVVVSGTLYGELFAGIIWGCTAFVLWRYGVVRMVLLTHLRAGTVQARAGQTTDALKSFARSAQAWEGRKWLDDLRGILLGSAATWPFRHLSRYNQAWCLAQLGHVQEARVVLEALLQEQPRMQVAADLLGALQPDEAPPEDPEPTDDWEALLHEDAFAEDALGDPLQDEPTLDPRGPDAG